MPPDLVLAPATSPTEQATFETLVERGVQRRELPGYIAHESDRIQHLWPVPADTEIESDSVSAGDTVLFYRGGNKYEWAATVEGVSTDSVDSQEGLSQLCADWITDNANVDVKPESGFSSTVLLLSIPYRVDLDSLEFHEQVDVRSDSLTRSLLLSAEQRAALVDDYGSLDQFISTIREPPDVFAELTSVSDKPYKQPDGEYPLGTAVFSRQEATDGSDRYQTMQEPQVGDIMLHLVKDTQELRGVSVVTSPLRRDFDGPPDNSWEPEARGDGYYLPLGSYQEFSEPLAIKDAVFQNELYSPRLTELREEYTHLPYDKRGHFVQGYLFRIPDALLYLLIAEEPALLSVCDQLHWSLSSPPAVESYDTISNATADIRTRLPFTSTDRDWIADQLTGALVADMTDAISGVQPDATVTQTEAVYCEMLAALYTDLSKTLEDTATELGIGTINQISPGELLFVILLRELQRHYGETANMNQVKLVTLQAESYEIETPEPVFETDDSAEPLTAVSEPPDGAEIRRQLEQTGQMVFYGPPGTGKTYTAQQFARWWLNELESDPMTDQLETVTFHPSFSYEDFIEGLSATNDDDGNLIYDEEPGVFKELADRARQAYYAAGDDESPRAYVLIIDEINRGNLAQIFGETITALEYDKRLGKQNETRVSLAHSGDSFSIPPNLYVIGTMNTADRSIALVDAALRRRFRFLGFPPDLEQAFTDREYQDWEGVQTATERGPNFDELLAKSFLAVEVLNSRIRNEPDLGRGKQIGHSFFYGPETEQELVDMWRFEILPLFEEYFFGQYERIRRALFDGGGDGLFDWEREQIRTFDPATLRAELEPIATAYPPE